MKRIAIVILLSVPMLAGCSMYRMKTTNPETRVTTEFTATSALFSRSFKKAMYERTEDGATLRIDGSTSGSQMEQALDLLDTINQLRTP